MRYVNRIEKSKVKRLGCWGAWKECEEALTVGLLSVDGRVVSRGWSSGLNGCRVLSPQKFIQTGVFNCETELRDRRAR